MKKIRWGYKQHFFESVVLERPCAMCGARAIVALPEPLLAEQPDDTTHVCHPLAGGCNHGFALEVTLTEVEVAEVGGLLLVRPVAPQPPRKRRRQKKAPVH